jgi:hypothetical protein
VPGGDFSANQFMLRPPMPPGCARAYSITSSAATCNVRGTFTPSVLAVLRLMNSSNFIGCVTSRSEGVAPLRIRPGGFGLRRSASAVL